MNPVLLIIGTRPEGIKMAPVYFALKRAHIPTLVCSTTQHTDLLDDVYQAFDFKPDIELHVMQQNQNLFHVTQQVLAKTKEVYEQTKPQLVLVHGDTTTTMAAALSAFYLQIPVGHIEAGLRTHNRSNPFPEEMNRRFVGMTASYHFAPTQQAVNNLRLEQVPDDALFYTGNTVVDALRIMHEKIATQRVMINSLLKNRIEAAQKSGQQIVLLTVHRRESFNGGIERILTTIKKFALDNPDVLLVYPYHPNPHIRDLVAELKLSEVPNILLSEPLQYTELVYVLVHAHWIATDSGGIQEEAVSVGKRVIVFREYTERPEGVWKGLATLVGTKSDLILQAFDREKQQVSNNTVGSLDVYGDGYAADKIVGIIQNILGNKKKESDEPHMHHGPWIHRPTNCNSSSRT